MQQNCRPEGPGQRLSVTLWTHDVYVQPKADSRVAFSAFPLSSDITLVRTTIGLLLVAKTLANTFICRVRVYLRYKHKVTNTSGLSYLSAHSKLMHSGILF